MLNLDVINWENVNAQSSNFKNSSPTKWAFVKDFVNKAQFKGGSKVTIDGLRVDFDDGWGLIRASNTTPKLVLRFEAKTSSRLKEIKNMFLNQLKLIDENGRKIMVCGLHNTGQGKNIENFSQWTCNFLASCIMCVD